MSLSVTGQGKYARQTGGRGQYGHVVVRLTLHDTGGVSVINGLAGAIPEQFIPAVENGIRAVISGGWFADRGYPGGIVELTGGSWHETDSSDLAFHIAAVMAMDDALLQVPRRRDAEGDDSPGVREPRTPRRPNPASAVAVPEPEN